MGWLNIITRVDKSVSGGIRNAGDMHCCQNELNIADGRALD